MHSSVWKWIFGISLTLLVLLIGLALGVWMLVNTTGAFASAVMSHTGADQLDYQGITFAVFMKDAIGSPIFYALLVDAAFLMVSIVMLIVPGRKKSDIG